jgi:DNA repair protein RadD
MFLIDELQGFMGLRPYQLDLKANIYNAWDSNFKNVLAVMPTGMGKTRLFCDIATDVAYNRGIPTAIEVHRKELVQQICLTLAELGIPHNIIAPKPTIQGIVSAERRLYRQQFYDYRAPVTVISVDTLKARIKHHENWAKSIGLWVVDESAHVLKGNKWGQTLNYFPNAIGLGVTATPQRLDKRGLGRHADGVFDTMILGPTTRWGIENGFLSKYKVVVPVSDYREHLKAAADGHDFTHAAMAEAAQKSHIVGDIVSNYEKFSFGKQAIVFSSDIASGQRTEQEFLRRGIKAKLLTGTTDPTIRFESLMQFRAKEIQVLLNVDLFDEGLDVPGIETVIMARPTESVSKYLQMCGRGLRPLEGKPHALIIDHVGNIGNKEYPGHGLPDNIRRWTLDRIVKRRDRINLLRICENTDCNAPFDRLSHECPYCGWNDDHKAISGGGGGKPSLPQVDGDLVLMDPETLRQMENDAILEDPAKVGQRVAQAIGADYAKKAIRDQRERIETQKELGLVIAFWAGKYRSQGYTDRQINKS